MESSGFQNFVHLHTHSEYSLTDGSIRIADLLKRVQSFGHKAVAITDHDNLFGAIEFYRKAKDLGIKAIIGCEVSIESFTFSDVKIKEEFKSFHPGLDIPDQFHIVLLVRNIQGYKNLIKLVSSIYGLTREEKIPGKVGIEYLKKHGTGITALSSCLLGEFAFLIRELKYALGSSKNFSYELLEENPHAKFVFSHIEKFIDYMQSCFGKEFFYAELIDNNLPDQKILLPEIAAVAKHFAVPLVASADAHYLKAEDSDSHALVTAIKNEMRFNDLGNRRQNAEFHVFDPEEFELKYQRWPESIKNTTVIADSIDLKIDFSTYYLPRYPLKEGESEADALIRLSCEGLEERFKYLEKIYGSKFNEEQKQKYRERLKYETDVINKMGFPGYFLIVQDFINWAKKQDIPVGPGRGSGAGSLVAYALKITDLDPIPYNLLFERFLNPERISMPDFDVDFCQDRRDEVIQYVNSHYGENSVAQITTFGKMQAKAVVKDVGRALEIPYLRVDKLSKLIPNDLGITLKDAYEKEPRIKQEAQQEPRIAELLSFADKLEGLTRHCSVHAAGIVISQGDMSDYVPVYRGEDGGLITHYEKDNVEKVGLVKFDFLGLKTLTVIHKAVKLVREKIKADFDISLIPLEDPKVYKEISTAHTIGIFQLESTGMQQLIAKLQPSKFEDLVAVVALFRPGPLGSGMVDDFIERKHGRQKIVYPLPQLEPILQETYGIILYQEQVQRIASELAGYSLGEADMLRRAMGKKKPEEMAKQKDRFMQGATANKIDPHLAGDIFELMSKFAEYGFNKSHSAAYGLVSYQTAYLKTYYPAQFMAAIMTCDLDNTDKIVRYVIECKRMGFNILPPDINHSAIEFLAIDTKTIRFALGAIKGIGAQSLQAMIDERHQKGVFTSLENLARRVPLNLIGKKTLELLCSCGALDGFGHSRSAMFESISSLVKFSQEIHTAQTTGQGLLFANFDEDAKDKNVGWEILEVPEDNPYETPNYWLLKEKSLLGVFISAHPLELFRQDQILFKQKFSDILRRGPSKEATPVLCYLADFQEKTTKTGKKMWVFILDDGIDSLEAMFFPRDQDMELLKSPNKDQIYVMQLQVDRGFDKSLRIKLEQWSDIESYREKNYRNLILHFDQLKINQDTIIETDKRKTNQASLKTLKNILHKYPGKTNVRIVIENQKASLSIKPKIEGVRVSNELIYKLSKLKLPGFNVTYQ